jgi:1,2-diacylglycerol 3-alpha-glucosyltransferase
VPALCRADECLDQVIRQGENGWQYTDEEAFRSCLEEFFSDPGRRQAMAQSALETAEEYSAALFAKRVEEIYLAQILRHQSLRKLSA